VDRPENLTSYRFAGNSHDPLIRPDEVASLRSWLRKHFPADPARPAMVYEDKLPLLQEQLRKSR
jgi:hypothetical protein